MAGAICPDASCRCNGKIHGTRESVRRYNGWLRSFSFAFQRTHARVISCGFVKLLERRRLLGEFSRVKYSRGSKAWKKVKRWREQGLCTTMFKDEDVVKAVGGSVGGYVF